MSHQPPPAYEKSVFINYPFDAEFRDLMLAIVFTVIAHGFIPRSARETEGTAQTRISRILDTISESKYSIHDLSRSTGEGAYNLARFNMPLELGMSSAFQFERRGSIKPHRWLALVPEGLHTNSSSPTLPDLIPADTMGRSLQLSGKFPPGCAYKTMSFAAPAALRIRESFAAFRAQTAKLRVEALGKEIWADLLTAAYQTLPPS